MLSKQSPLLLLKKNSDSVIFVFSQEGKHLFHYQVK